MREEDDDVDNLTKYLPTAYRLIYIGGFVRQKTPTLVVTILRKLNKQNVWLKYDLRVM